MYYGGSRRFVMSSMIGIKVANGTFFPVLTDNVAVKKRLVLTTAHDGQTSVQIDFYKTAVMSLEDAVYIGTLLIENIEKNIEGGPSIEVIASIDEDGEFSASAYDMNNPKDKNNHILTVSLAQPVNDIDFEANDLLLPEDAALSENDSSDYSTVVKTKSKGTLKPKIFIIIGSTLVLLALIACGLLFFVFKPSAKIAVAEKVPAFEQSQPEPELLPTSPEPQAIPPNPPPAVESAAPVITAPEPPVTPQPQTRRERPPAPVSSYKTPSVIPAGGVAYKLRWGDTLWDISQAFYRTPWRYKYLARYNGIRNPDHIISGRTIRVPPLPK
jgi:hypothetical protein